MRSLTRLLPTPLLLVSIVCAGGIAEGQETDEKAKAIYLDHIRRMDAVQTTYMTCLGRVALFASQIADDLGRGEMLRKAVDTCRKDRLDGLTLEHATTSRQLGYDPSLHQLRDIAKRDARKMDLELWPEQLREQVIKAANLDASEEPQREITSSP